MTIVQLGPKLLQNAQVTSRIIPGLVYAIICYILASKHKKRSLPSLVIIKKFAIVLQYYPKFIMVL